MQFVPCLPVFIPAYSKTAALGRNTGIASKDHM